MTNPSTATIGSYNKYSLNTHINLPSANAISFPKGFFREIRGLIHSLIRPCLFCPGHRREFLGSLYAVSCDA